MFYKLCNTAKPVVSYETRKSRDMGQGLQQMYMCNINSASYTFSIYCLEFILHIFLSNSKSMPGVHFRSIVISLY